MFDLGKQTIAINCPTCNKKHTVTLNKVSSNSTINCSCRTNISLKDSNGKVKRTVSDINKEFKKFEDTLKKLAR
jgi:methionine synthase I (cobalamin-dependent)